MRTPYTFSLLRFIYDPLTREFVNVGIVVYSPETKLLMARCTQHYSRISKLFVSFDGVRLRQTLRFVQDQINDVGRDLETRLQFRPPSAMHEVLGSVLPIDDSSLQFAKGGVGISENMAETIDSLFYSYVERYSSVQESTARDDDDVWKSFRSSFDRRNITPHLTPKRIVATNYDYEFERAWKNGSWHLYEPISLDLLDASAIKEKANRWVGRAMSLEDSKEDFKLFLLLGAPADERLKKAYREAENLLNRMPIPHEFVEESESESFAKHVATEMKAHDLSRGV